MGEKNKPTDEDGYTVIKVPDADDTYLKAMSGKELETAESDQTTCSKCGLSARTRGELQDHFINAHNEDSAKE